jgi:ATP-dependent Clp protease protease subunit
MNDRIITLNSTIDSKNISSINYRILCINDDDKYIDGIREPIRLHISSYGGTTYDMNSLIDIIETSKTPIYTYCDGYCMSAAAVIFVCGHKRFIYNNSVIMFHQISGFAGGKYLDIKYQVDEFNIVQRGINEIVLNKTNIPSDLYYDYIDRCQDLYLRKDDILKYRVADVLL